MSRRHQVQDATGVVIEKLPTGIMYIIATTTPTNSQPGYGTGCVWVNTAGTATSIFYVNSGTNTSSTWTNLV